MSGSERKQRLLAPLLFVFAAFITSRLVVTLSGFVGINLLIGADPSRSKGALAEAALMWDGAWYWRVFSQGYFAWNPGTGSNLAFCPLYPLLTRIGAAILDLFNFHFGDPVYGNFALVGLLISNLAFLAALYVLWFLLRLDYSARVVTLVLWLISLFPAGLFWSAIYTESLFLLLVVSSFYAARRGWWWAAAILAGLAAITRWAGVFLAVALLIEYISQQRSKWASANVKGGFRHEAAQPAASSQAAASSSGTYAAQSASGASVVLPGRGVAPALALPALRLSIDTRVVWLALAPLPLLAYMAWLGSRFGDPLVFLEAEHQGWQHTSAFFPFVFWDSCVMLWQSWTHSSPLQPDPVMHWGNGQWLYMLQDLTFILIFSGLALVGLARKWLRPSYLVYLAIGIIFPLSTGTTLAMTRYLAPLFPAFVVLALLLEKRRWLAWPWLVVSTILLAVTTFYWASGRWMG